MASINNCFASFISAITPSGERINDVVNACEKVRDYIDDEDGFETLKPSTLLIGSYKRHTAVKDIHDVDLLVFPAGDEGEIAPSAMLDELRSVMEAMPEARKSTRSQNRSVRITLFDDSIDLDIVPAFNRVDGNLEPLRIPDREAASWIETNPMLYGEKLTELNKANRNLVLPTIRLVKLWRDNAFDDDDAPKSFWIEAMLYELIDGDEVELEGNYQRTMIGVFEGLGSFVREALESGVEPQITDPGLDRVIDANWGLDRWAVFASKADSSLALAEEAIGSDDFAIQFERWGEVFGEDWAASCSDGEERVADAVASGTATVSAGGALQMSGEGQRVPPVRAYGE